MIRRICALTAMMLGLSCLAGCSEIAAAMYFLRPPKKVPAEYALKSESLLVLVDDDQGLIQPPTARMLLVDALARELKAHNLAQKVTTNEELARLRQAEPRFDQRGAREIGQLAEADTVLLLSTQTFSMEDDLEMASVPAKFAVTVRVINAKAETADQVRLWPPETTEREGRLVEAQVDPHTLRGAKSSADAHVQLANALAVKVAELFYERRVDD
ncbi:MAG TPA: hypothetical protein PKG54_04135 [Phycisphaerae bacterium]|jgi:hypothetical protein|nr:hypothetical protein [Phycisphaerae bacterium]HOB73694.1 hypothetical protein [Phycisphaerae bacterium]HOJ53432.1 hypothetical protein [Phycisphaerae bacterium]HOL25444.1 hypothetical protein [Phycisphaerae bacterium]HPP19879.1 hypothetical protein [Phycisphaerae bacterium]